MTTITATAVPSFACVKPTTATASRLTTTASLPRLTIKSSLKQLSAAVVATAGGSMLAENAIAIEVLLGSGVVFLPSTFSVTPSPRENIVSDEGEVPSSVVNIDK